MKLLNIINENTNVDKERKRVKTIHKAIRRGIVTVEGYRFRYELPEEYTFHMVDDVLTQTSIKFTFYNHDLGQNFGGVGLPLRVWRIEDGKDVFVNGNLSKDNVSDIVYGDEYLLNTRSGVDYANVKNKVKNKYGNFDINCIMTTPSDTIMVNEEEKDNNLTEKDRKKIELIYKWEEQIDLNENHDDYKQKQIKKGKTVYKALRKGTIGSNDPNEPHFSYELPDDFSVYSINVVIIISLNKIKIKELNRGCNLGSFNADYMGNSIRKRFSHFGIVLISSYGDRYFEYDIEPWERPLNEEKDNNLTIKDRKKIELIYKLFKTGKYKDDDMVYRYILPDDYWMSNDDETGELIVVLTMNPTQTLNLYAVFPRPDGKTYDRYVDKVHASLYNEAKRRIKDKFERYNIQIIF
jgi:hypothetical protein